jgi:hypothetical protein
MKILTEDDMCTDSKFRLASILCSFFANDAPLFTLCWSRSVHRKCMTQKHEHRVIGKLQCGLTAVESWCERWNIKVNEGKIGDGLLLL